MHTVLYCRVILNLRGAARRDSTIPSRASEVRFWESVRIMETAYELGDIEQEPSTCTTPVGSDSDKDSIQLDV